MRPLSAALVLLSLACAGAPGTPDYHVPLPAELSTTADSHLDQVDRSAALAGALDPDAASLGQPLDFAAAPAPFAMVVDARGMDTEAGLTGAPEGPTTRFNVVHAAQMVVVADATTALVIGLPAAAAAIALDGVSTEIAPNVWASTNAVSDGVTTVTGLFVVAWVEVGWIAEMRLWSSDGRWNNTRWYNGFLSADQRLGWWDLYDGTQLAGVVEWTDDGQGQSQLGLAAVSGENAGDVLLYAFVDDTGFVGFHDAAYAQDYYVYVEDGGELLDPGYNGGAPACWDAEGNDVACDG